MNASEERALENSDGTREAPTAIFAIFRMLGPGLIIAASIVGSGELIATTKAGAGAGMSLLWLIILGCVIKVFAQIEIGRYTMISGLPTLSAFDSVPGPRIQGRGNWLVWYWFIMWLASIGQLGGIVGSVGQATAIMIPVTEQGKLYNAMAEKKTLLQVEQVLATKPDAAPNSAELIAQLTVESTQLQAEYANKFQKSLPRDDMIWTIPWAIGTSFLLWFGRYRLIQAVSTILVAVFTMITVGNVFAIQNHPSWALTATQWINGLIPSMPEGNDAQEALKVAMMTLGIIGVGASELVQYPYWLLEKGYARWTGRHEAGPKWVTRAKGWLRVMQCDAWTSMVIYTIATIAFYVLGAAILHPSKLVPGDSDLIRTLQTMYQPVFSSYAPILFMFGAFAVLYSTYFVANASHARTFADALVVMGFLKREPVIISRTVRYLSFLFPLLCCAIYIIFPQPVFLILLSALTQAIMLPMLGAAALYFRYWKCIPELRPSKLWDVFLIGSFGVLLVIGTYNLVTKGQDLLKFFGVLSSNA